MSEYQGTYELDFERPISLSQPMAILLRSEDWMNFASTDVWKMLSSTF